MTLNSSPAIADSTLPVLPVLDDVHAARARIMPYLRRTPLIAVQAIKDPLGDPKRAANVTLKLENMQVTGSFKARGAISKMTSLSTAQLQRGIITASGGNHGLGVAYAGWVAHVPATVYLSRNVPTIKAELLRRWNAEVVHHGEVWDDANDAALIRAEADGLTYIHPFADPVVIAGQGTIALEVLEDLPNVDTLLVAIGGGGLISGVSLTAKAINPNIKVIGVEPVGAPTLRESLARGEVITLESVHTLANTLAPRRSAPINFEIIRRNVDDIVLVTDAQMTAAARWLWLEMGIGCELSGAAALAALQTGVYIPEPGENVCVLVCGAGTAGF